VLNLFTVVLTQCFSNPGSRPSSGSPFDFGGSP